MTIGFLFWLLMILWFLADVLCLRPTNQRLLLFILLFLLGWKVFGFVIHG